MSEKKDLLGEYTTVRQPQLDSMIDVQQHLLIAWCFVNQLYCFVPLLTLDLLILFTCIYLHNTNVHSFYTL